MSQSISAVGVLRFEDARMEMLADHKPLEPKLPWLGTAVGLALSLAGLVTLAGS